MGEIIDRTGEINLNTQGLKMEIIQYNNANNLIVKFEDGKTKKSAYKEFKKGWVKHPDFILNRVGEENITTNGSRIKILKYNNEKDIVVEFMDYNYQKKSSYHAFKRGEIVSPYCKVLCGVGYKGEGKYNHLYGKKTHNTTKCYRTWTNMIKRCYSERAKYVRQTYKNATVCEEWWNFQVFAEWFEENYYEIEGKEMHLDKDILYKGNKIYSPETCVFVPNNINNLFTKSDKARGKYPIGVTYDERGNTFLAYCCDGTKKCIRLGSFNNPMDAFNEYKRFKELTIKKIADKYKDGIPQKLYDALYRYEVNITD